MAEESRKVLSHEQARRFYDLFGAKQDSQAFYEDAALGDMIAHLKMEDCRAIIEFGCGTGRLAAELFDGALPPQTTYLGVDVSPTMVVLAKTRLSRWSVRAVIRQSDGAPRIEAADGRFDRFISSYVLDLLSEDDIRAVIGEAHRVLAPDGLLGLVSLTNGRTPLSRFLTAIWKVLHALSPWFVGGCRPIVIESYLTGGDWKIEHAKVISRFGVPSEIVVAKRVQG